MAIQLIFLPSGSGAAQERQLKSVKIPSDTAHTPLAPASGTQKAGPARVGRSNRLFFSVGKMQVPFRTVIELS